MLTWLQITNNFLYSLQLQCNSFCSCYNLQLCTLLILVNKILFATFSYKRLLDVARILWLGAHIFITYSITENNLPYSHANPVDSISAFQQCDHQNSLLETEMGTGWFWHLLEMKWGTVSSELPEPSHFLCLSQFFGSFPFHYLLQDSEIFPVLHILMPSLIPSLTPFFHTETYTERCEVRASQR